MDVVVARRKEGSDVLVWRQPAKGSINNAMNIAVGRISIELHDVIALWVRARNGVAGLLWFWNFQHASTHVALNLDGFRSRWFWRVAQRSSDIGRPAEGISVFVLRRVHF